MRFHILLISLIPFLSSGCLLSRAHSNHTFDSAAIESFQPGVTTAGDVVQALGAPLEIRRLKQRTAYRYEHTHSKKAGFTLLIILFINEDTQADRLWVFFDGNDVLTHYGVTTEAEDARFTMPWMNID